MQKGSLAPENEEKKAFPTKDLSDYFCDASLLVKKSLLSVLNGAGYDIVAG